MTASAALTPPTTVDRLRALVHEKFDVPLEAIVPDAPFSSYDLDSLTVAELMFSIDDELHVVVPDEALREIATLRQLADVVDRLPATSRAA